MVSGSCDPFAIVTLTDGKDRMESKRTKTKRKTASPLFDETFHFNVSHVFAITEKMTPVLSHHTFSWSSRICTAVVTQCALLLIRSESADVKSESASSTKQAPDSGARFWARFESHCMRLTWKRVTSAGTCFNPEPRMIRCNKSRLWDLCDSRFSSRQTMFCPVATTSL